MLVKTAGNLAKPSFFSAVSRWEVEVYCTKWMHKSNRKHLNSRDTVQRVQVTIDISVRKRRMTRKIVGCLNCQKIAVVKYF